MLGEEDTVISGIFENCVGADQLTDTLHYWAELGYREVDRGQLTAEQAGVLYGYSAALTSVRLQNGNSADHGLVRVMLWEKPRNAGLGFALPLVQGSRWFASLVKDVYVVADAFADDKENGGNWNYTEPVRGIEGIGHQGTGLFNRFVGVREMFVIGPQTRQAFFQRYNYDRPGYGTIDPSSPMQVSEGTHSSIVTSNHDLSLFYMDVFGLIPMEFNVKRSGYQNPATRQILMMQDGQEFLLSAFVSPKMTVGMFQVYTPLYPTPDHRSDAQPGSLGLCLFTYQVEDITAVHDRVTQSPATQVTPIVSNEFGEASFGLVAPDGMYWVIVAKQ